jgi:hypothetical protein
MRKAIYFLAVVLLPAWAAGQNQPEIPPTKFAGKSIGLYLSLKNLSFEGHYYKMMAAWLQRQDSLNLQYEDIRIGVAVKLTNYLTVAIRQHLGADTVYNINADVALGTALVNSYRGETINPGALQKVMPPGTDYLVIIDLVTLNSRKVNTLYAFSNDVIAEKRAVQQANLRVRVFTLARAEAIAHADVRFDEDISPNQRAYYATPSGGAPAQRAFDTMFNTLWAELFSFTW